MSALEMPRKISFVLLFFTIQILTLPAIGLPQASSLVAPKEVAGLVRVGDIDPTVVVDLKYATEDNFTHRRVYPVSVCLLRKETAQKLAAANAEFAKDGYRIKVWDAFRPLYVQKIFWDLVPDSRYVADPNAGGSRHNRGGAVDITLVDKEGRELEMPSAFDDFSEKASPTNPAMSEQAKKNVAYLEGAMVRSGFQVYEHEWWHFDDSDWKDYPLVDVPLEQFLEYDNPLPEELKGLDQSVSQAVVVEAVAGAASMARVSVWEKKEGGWELVSPVWQANVGKNGIAPPGEKREGDGRTPAGIFHLALAFGYGDSAETGLTYRQAGANDFWVDDAESPDYNQWVTGLPEAKSYEILKRDDDLYKFGIVIEYNTDLVLPGRGSAIFMHVWRGPGTVTAGCVALAQENLLSLLKRLDKNSNPVVIIK